MSLSKDLLTGRDIHRAEVELTEQELQF